MQIRSIILFPLLLLPFESALGGKIAYPVQYLKPIGCYPDGSIVYQMEMTTVLIEESVVVQANEYAPGSPPALIKVVSPDITDVIDATDVTGAKYTCAGCSKSFTTYPKLQQHREKALEPDCRGNLEVKCTGCDRDFDTHCLLRSHRQSATEEKCRGKMNIKCSGCATDFTSYNKLQIHRQKATEEKCRGKLNTKCSGCATDFTSYRELQMHRQNATEEKCRGKINIKCSGCATDFTSYQALQSHRKNATEEKCRGNMNIKCSGCQTKFTSYNLLRNHKRTTKNQACQSTRKHRGPNRGLELNRSKSTTSIRAEALSEQPGANAEHSI